MFDKCFVFRQTTTLMMDQLIETLKEFEQIGDIILNDRRKLIDYDMKRQKNREALRAIDKVKDDQTKIWFCHGNSFVRMDSNQVKTKINNDNQMINDNIDKIRSETKLNLAKLKRMEGREEFKGFDLNPLSQDELKNLQKLL